MTSATVILSSEDANAIALFQEAVGSHNQQLAETGGQHVPIKVVFLDYPRPALACGGIDPSKSLGLKGKGVPVYLSHTRSPWPHVWFPGYLSNEA